MEERESRYLWIYDADRQPMKVWARFEASGDREVWSHASGPDARRYGRMGVGIWETEEDALTAALEDLRQCIELAQRLLAVLDGWVLGADLMSEDAET